VGSLRGGRAQVGVGSGLEVVDGQKPPAQLLGVGGSTRRRPPAGPDHGQPLGLLALCHRDQGKDAVLNPENGVVALSHAEQQGVAGNRAHGVPVGMGDRQAVATQGNPEGRVGGGVDHAQPQPVAWPRRQGRRRSGLAAVDQVQRIADVAGVIAQRSGRLDLVRHAAPMIHAGHVVVHAGHAVVHPGHVGVVHAVGLQAGKDPVRCLADAVGPVVKDDDGLAVVAPRLGRVLHD
jgi:hypothetical protein